jgi:hypothetical protein
MDESATYMRGVANRARQLSLQAPDLATRKMLVVVASIFDDRAEKLQEPAQNEQAICVEPGPAGFRFSEDDLLVRVQEKLGPRDARLFQAPATEAPVLLLDRLRSRAN